MDRIKVIEEIVNKYTLKYEGKKDKKGKSIFRKIPVENFLISCSGQYGIDSMNLELDAASYKWSPAIRNAILEGLKKICK